MTDTRRPSAWQPMESAPKDGTEVLGWDGFFMAPIQMLPANYLGDDEPPHWHPLARPTHWQPMPPPPNPDD